MPPRYAARRRELAEAAPTMPDTMPVPHHKMNPVDALFPIAQKLYNTDEEVRKLASSINIDNSPSGRLCYDDARLAMKAKAAIEADGVNPLLDSLTLGKLGTVFKRCLARVGLSRTKRIEAARNNLLTSRAQPAE